MNYTEYWILSKEVTVSPGSLTIESSRIAHGTLLTACFHQYSLHISAYWPDWWVNWQFLKSNLGKNNPIFAFMDPYWTLWKSREIRAVKVNYWKNDKCNWKWANCDWSVWRGEQNDMLFIEVTKKKCITILRSKVSALYA